MTQENQRFSALLIAYLLTGLRQLFLQVMIKFDKFIDLVTLKMTIPGVLNFLLDTKFI